MLQYKVSGGMSQSQGSTIQENELSCIEFTYEQLRNATSGFSENCKLGEGGFGPVYQGKLIRTVVAIKQLRKVQVLL